MLKITRKPGEALTLITSDGEIHIDVELLDQAKYRSDKNFARPAITEAKSQH